MGSTNCKKIYPKANTAQKASVDGASLHCVLSCTFCSLEIQPATLSKASCSHGTGMR